MPKLFVKLGVDQTRFILRLKNVNAHTLLHESTTDARNYLAVREQINSSTQDWTKTAKHYPVKKDTRGEL